MLLLGFPAISPLASPVTAEEVGVFTWETTAHNPLHNQNTILAISCLICGVMKQ